MTINLNLENYTCKMFILSKLASLALSSVLSRGKFVSDLFQEKHSKRTNETHT